MTEHPTWVPNAFGMKKLANPPEGLVIIQRERPPAAEIADTLDDFASVLSPEQAKILRESAERVRRRGDPSG